MKERVAAEAESEFLERHTRKCSICRHPDRDAIEEEFIHWHRVIWIAQQYEICDHRSIYRHARATGLIRARRENLHSALDNIVEQSDGIRASADAILRAMRAYTCLDAHGRWTDPAPPPRQLIYSNAADRGAASATSFVGRGFRDVSVPDASAGSRDITNAVGDPSTSTQETNDESAVAFAVATADRTKRATFEAAASVAEPARRDGPTPASKTRGTNDESAASFEIATGRAQRTTSEASESLASPPEAEVLPAEAPETDSEVQSKTNRPQADTFEAPASPARASGAITTALPSSAAYSSTQAQPATSEPPAARNEDGDSPSEAETPGDGLDATGGPGPSDAADLQDPATDPDYIEEAPDPKAQEEEEERARKAEALRQRDINDRLAGINRYPYGHPLR